MRDRLKRRRSSEEEPSENDGKDLIDIYGKFSHDKRERDQQLQELARYSASLDLLSVCYHGSSRSADLLQAIREYANGSPKLDNTGIKRLASKVTALRLHVDERNVFIKQLAEALSNAKAVALFDEPGHYDTLLEKQIAAEIVQQTDAKRKKIYFIFADGQYAKAVQSFMKLKE